MSAYLDIADAALAALRGADGVELVEARVVELERDVLALRGEIPGRGGGNAGGDADSDADSDNDRIERMDRSTSAGVGVRVLRDGAWGFAALPGPTVESAEAAARQAAEVARGVAAAQPERVRLTEEEPQRGTYETPVAEDPFAVPNERKLSDLRAALSAMRGAQPDPRVRSLTAHQRWDRVHSALATSEGTRVVQTRTFGGAGIAMTASDGDIAVKRSWPMDFDGGLGAGGYEMVGRLALAENGARLHDETLALLVAPECPSGRTNLVLDTPQLALQIHESCGHPTESDRAIGDEISLAGASFLTPDKLGRFTYGAPIVNMTADATRPGGLGTFGWDDEGVPARVTPLVSRGVFVGYLSSRETAASMALGRSAGCLRAESWNRPPIIRMINVSLEPDPNGPSSLDELSADTDDGILMTTNRSWSIDDLRLNFQFSCEAAWEIKGGKRTRILRSPLYTGSTPAFWRSCDAIGNADAFRMWGLSSCGKGDPMQLMPVGHGCAPARFRNVEVGAAS